MKRNAVSALVAILLVVAGVGPVGAAAGATQQDCSFPVTGTDATGTEVTVAEEPQQIVTLNPSAAQTVWEIGGEGKVVGVSKYAQRMSLEGAQSRTNVSGAGMSVNTEQVVALEPDLVLAPNVIPDQTVDKLRQADLTVYKFEAATSLEDIYAKTRLIGELTGECEGATETVSWMKDRVDAVKQAVEGEDTPRVLYSSGFGWTAGNGTFMNSMIAAAGGDNVAANAGIDGSKQISSEVVIQRDPQWIVTSGAAIPDGYNSTTAVEQNQTVVLNANNASQPAPRVVYPIVKMAKAFHPEAYAAANRTTEATTAAAGETTTATETTTTASTGQPGFGVAAGLAAVALVALGRFGRE